MKKFFALISLSLAFVSPPAWSADPCAFDQTMQAYGSWSGIGSVFVPCPYDESAHCSVQQNLFGGSGAEFFPDLLAGMGRSIAGGGSSGGALEGGLSTGDETCCGDEGGPTGPGGWSGPEWGAGCCGGDTRGLGMAVWSVTEPMLDLWVQDVPVWYQPGRGPRLEFKLAYKHLEASEGMPNWFGFGPRWTANICAYATLHGTHTNHVAVHHGDGAVITYDLTVSNSFYSRASIASIAGGGFRLTYPGGVKQEFAAPVTNNGTIRYCLSKVDYLSTSSADDLTFSYQLTNTTFRLTKITDGAGHQTTLAYTNAGTNAALIARITVPGGLYADFLYDGNGWLTNITDAAGNKSRFVYDGTNGLKQLLTPYGTTSFVYTNSIANGLSDWQVLQVDELGLRKHLFVFLAEDTAGRVPAGYTNEVPNTTPSFPNTFETNGLNLRNSFYWGPRQYDLLSATVRTNLAVGAFNPSQLGVGELARGRQRHWLMQRAGFAPSHTISLERGPSADGSTPGPLTWYDYEGKYGGSNEREGYYKQPRFVARVLPNGQTSFVYKGRNGWGNPTSLAETWSLADGSVSVRQTSFVYTNGGRNLILRTAPDQTLAGYSCSAVTGRLLRATNALGEVTSFSYDAEESTECRTMTTPLLTVGFSYGDTNHPGLPTQVVDSGTGLQRTNSYAYTNGLIWKQTDPRGLTITNAFDGLGRLVRVSFPDGTYTSNYFDKLLLAGVRARSGNWTRYGYDQYGRKLGVTNALGRVTTFGYCDCGSLESITDALTNTTSLQYDDLGRRTRVVRADTTWEETRYDLLGRVTSVAESSGYSVTNAYNQQGLVYSVSNVLGSVSYREFDIMDRVVKNIDANSVTVTNQFDGLSRLIKTSRNGDSTYDLFTYDVSGLISSTKDLVVTYYTNDAAGRRIAERNPNGEVTQFRYDAAGALTNLIDPALKTTQWLYDLYGRATNKLDDLNNLLFIYRYDAGSRLTNRWTPAKGNTFYAYDAVGNLTNVDYAASPDLRLGYDALNRLTNLVDAVGQTRYGYNVVGQLTLEDGPWDDDAVSLSYTNRQRIGLSMVQPRTSAWTQSYAYDAARRLTNMVSPAGTFGYAYTGAQPLLPAAIALPGSLTITNNYDGLARLAGRWLKKADGTVLDSHGYVYASTTDRLRRVTRLVGNTLDYGYDPAGQLTSARGMESGGTDRLHEQLGYAYDAAGNLVHRTNNTMLTTLEVGNSPMNQIWRAYADLGATLTVAGAVSTNSTNVTVNGWSAARYADGTFASAGQTWSYGANTYTAIAQDALGRRSTNSLQAVLADEVFYSYDANGNTTESAGRYLDYDDENQLIRITEAGAWKSEFAYDGKMRRRVRNEYTWLTPSSTWLQTNEVRYVYDGMLVIQERHYNPQLSTNVAQLVVTYTRGPDLSRRLQGAGGIGGLLARTEATPSALNSQTSIGLYFSDNLGNVSMMVGTNGQTLARYQYEPFGNITAMTGLWSERNLYRFSSKEWHQNSGLIYHGYRFYSPNLQRWVNRDPMAGDPQAFEYFGHRRIFPHPVETWFCANLYQYVGNAPASFIDPNGLWTFQVGVSISIYLGTFSFGFSVGIVGDTQGNINGYITPGAGVGTGAGVGAGVSVAVSNAKCNKDLEGWFGAVGLGGGLGASGSVDGFWGNSDNGKVFGGGGTVGVGLGAGISAQPTYTVIKDLP